MSSRNENRNKNSNEQNEDDILSQEISCVQHPPPFDLSQEISTGTEMELGSLNTNEKSESTTVISVTNTDIVTTDELRPQIWINILQN